LATISLVLKQKKYFVRSHVMSGACIDD